MSENIIRQGLGFAKKAAKKAGALQLKLWSSLKVKEKNSSIDIVTNLDTLSENLILSILQKAFPHHNYLKEESGFQDQSSPYTWVIDPIDGTTNYSKKLPYFSVSIALYKEQKPLLGVVYCPPTQELFWAARGQGAYLGQTKLRCTACPSLNQALLITGFYYDRGEGMRQTLGAIERFFGKNIMGIRRFGSAALDLCYLASGRCDGFWELELSPWDFGAGLLIAQEAGALVRNLEDEEPGLNKSFILAAGKELYPQMRQVLLDH